MTNEEKRLLLKVLCEGLPYRTEISLTDGTSGMITSINIVPHGTFVTVYFNRDNVEDVSLEDIKPYLRPLSSMTEEEQYEYNTAIDNDIEPERIVDWYNLHHFDYRGLISKGLALEAPEGMYKVDLNMKNIKFEGLTLVTKSDGRDVHSFNYESGYVYEIK